MSSYFIPQDTDRDEDEQTDDHHHPVTTDNNNGNYSDNEEQQQQGHSYYSAQQVNSYNNSGKLGAASWRHIVKLFDNNICCSWHLL